jgi:hypothetical protein
MLLVAHVAKGISPIPLQGLTKPGDYDIKESVAKYGNHSQPLQIARGTYRTRVGAATCNPKDAPKVTHVNHGRGCPALTVAQTNDKVIKQPLYERNLLNWLF